MNRNEQGRRMHHETFPASSTPGDRRSPLAMLPALARRLTSAAPRGSWLHGLAVFALVLVGTASAGCGDGECKKKCASAFGGELKAVPPPGLGAPWVAVGSFSLPEDIDDDWESDTLVIKLGPEAKLLGRQVTRSQAGFAVGYAPHPSTRIADGRLLLELFDDRIKIAQPKVLGTVYFDVTQEFPPQITAEQFEVLAGNKTQPLFKDAFELDTARRYLACAGLTMTVAPDGKSTELKAKLRNNSDLAQLIDPTQLLGGGSLAFDAIRNGAHEDSPWGSERVLTKTTFRPWETRNVSVTVAGTPAALSGFSVLFVGYTLDGAFLGCSLPLGSIKTVMTSRSQGADSTGLVFNGFLGADPMTPGNWCWTDDPGSNPVFWTTNPGETTEQCPTSNADP